MTKTKEITYSSLREVRQFTLTLVEPMLGTVPKDKEVYATYIESKKPKDLSEDNETETVEEIEEKGWTGFHKDENGLFIYDYMIKGYIKSVANTLKDIFQIKAMRSKIVQYLWVQPRRIYFGKQVPDGTLERPLMCQTQQGPRVTLARSDYINPGTTLDFSIGILRNPHFNFSTLDQLFFYATDFGGLGQNRAGGYGKFTVTVK